jgi:hypothetical protein
LICSYNFSSERSVNHTGESSSNAIGQLQSILPVNASEILDRLINDITSNDGSTFSSSAGSLVNNVMIFWQNKRIIFSRFLDAHLINKELSVNMINLIATATSLQKSMQ